MPILSLSPHHSVTTVALNCCNITDDWTYTTQSSNKQKIIGSFKKNRIISGKTSPQELYEGMYMPLENVWIICNAPKAKSAITERTHIFVVGGERAEEEEGRVEAGGLLQLCVVSVSFQHLHSQLFNLYSCRGLGVVRNKSWVIKSTTQTSPNILLV